MNNKKNNNMYLFLSLILIGSQSSYANDVFKHDSVISPLKLGDYKYLNGCPAILKTETKKEPNCPVGYTGEVEYQRTLNADRVLFGDNVACEQGGTWSAWKEIGNTCIIIPPPTPNDLLKADSCNVFSVNGKADDWYYFRRNPKEAFLKSNYDKYLASGKTVEDFYSTLLLPMTEKSYININNQSTICSFQSNSIDYPVSYSITRNDNKTLGGMFTLSTLIAASYSKYGVASTNISFSSNLTDGVNNGYNAVYINGKNNGIYNLKNINKFEISNNTISEANLSNYRNVNDIGVIGGDFNFNDFTLVKNTSFVLNGSNINSNKINVTGGTVNFSRIKSSNINDINLSDTGNVSFSGLMNIKNDLIINNNLTGGISSFTYGELNVGNNLSITNGRTNSMHTYKIKTNNLILNNISMFTLGSSFYITSPKINLNSSALNNNGSLNQDAYITGDVYLNSTPTVSDYNETLYGHLNGNVYGLPADKYDLIDVTSCSDVYINGKNSRWVAFKSLPKNAFLLDVYTSQGFTLVDIRKNLISSFGKIYSQNAGINCMLTVMASKEPNKDVNITNKSHTVTNSGNNSDSYLTDRGVLNLKTVGSLNMDMFYFPNFKGDITYDNSANNSTTFKLGSGSMNGNLIIIGGDKNKSVYNLSTNVTGDVTVSNANNFSIPVSTYGVNIGGNLNFKDVLNVSVIKGNIGKSIYFDGNVNSDVTYLNMSGSIVNSGVYLNDYVYYSDGGTNTIKGGVFNPRVDRVILNGSNVCNDIKINGAIGNWGYYESNPNMLFNTDTFTSSNYNTQAFKEMLNSKKEALFFNNNSTGKRCVIGLNNYNNDKSSLIDYSSTNGSFVFGTSGSYDCVNSNFNVKSISFVNGGFFSCSITADSMTFGYNASFRSHYNNDVNAYKVNINNLKASGLDISVMYGNNINIKNINVDSLNLSEGSLNSDNINTNSIRAVMFYLNAKKFNLNLAAIGNRVPPATVTPFYSSGGNLNIDEMTVSKHTVSYVPTSSYILDILNTNLKSTNGIKLDSIADAKITVNNKTSSVITGVVYLNNISYFERDATSKVIGYIYGGINDYSSVGQ